MVSVVAHWYFEEWGRTQKDNSYEKTLAKVQSQMNKDRIPLHILAVEDDGHILGVAQLKYHEMSIYPERTYWLGGVFVSTDARGKGVGLALVQKIIEIARSFGVDKLSLQTEKFDGGIYSKCGFEPVEKVTYIGIDVLVMEKNLKEVERAPSMLSSHH